MAISHVGSGDAGSVARAKINAAIDKANLVDSKADASALTAESTSRTSGYAAIASAIAAEVSARQVAVNNEGAARQSGDSALALAIAAETAARENVALLEAQARQAADEALAEAVSAEATARQGGDAEEAAAREAGDELRVRYFEGGAPAIRPGESGDFFTGTLGNEPSTLPPIAANLKAVSRYGSTVRLTSGGTVAPRGVWGVEPQRQYRARFAFSRSTDTEDPANDAVRLGLQWLRADKTQISQKTLADIVDITVESGRVEYMFTFATADSDIVEFVAPARTVYVRPFVRVYGSGATDIEVIEITDLSTAINFSPDLSDLRRSVAAYDARTTIALDRVEGVDAGLAALSSHVDDLNTETNERITELIAQEAQSRIAGDTRLSEDIAAEQTARISAITALTDGAPTGLNTFDKVATAIEDDPNFGTTIRAYVDGIIALQDAMVFKGVVDASANPNYPAADRGWTYRISVAGKIGGASGKVVEVGDIAICLTDATVSGNEAAVGAQWTVVQTNLDGAVIGPASAVDGTPMVADGTSGKLLKNITFAAFKTLLALVKGDVGLGNVDNTADVNKPISTAAQAAFDLTAPLNSPALAGTPTAPTASATDNSQQIANTAMVQSALAAYIAAQDVLVFKGVVDCSTNPNYPAASAGHVYKVSVAGKIGGASGPNVEIGDVLTCLVDSSASGTHAAVGANWVVSQVNLDGAVIGPASATDGTPIVADGASGRLVKNVSFPSFKTSLALAKGDVGLSNVVNLDTSTQANVAFTGLTAAAAVADADTLPVNQGAANLKQTFSAVKTWIKAWIVKADVGLGNVDNTSDSTKNAAAVALTNKTFDASLNTLSNLTTAMFASGVIDTDTTLAANSNTRIAPQATIKAYVDGIIEAANALQYKGTIDCSANPNYPAANAGHFYIVSVAGKIGGASGITVETGDALICKTDSSASGNQATAGANWGLLQFNLIGALTSADIGGTVQARSAILDAFVALTPSNDDILQRKAGAWTNRTIAQLGADLAPTAQAITLSNSWVDYGSTLTPSLKAWLSSDKRVVIEGCLKNGTTTGGTVIGVLPAGCRPAYDQLFIVCTYSTSAHAVIRVKPNGDIVGELGLNASLTSLSGITFIAA